MLTLRKKSFVVPAGISAKIISHLFKKVNIEQAVTLADGLQLLKINARGENLGVIYSYLVHQWMLYLPISSSQ